MTDFETNEKEMSLASHCATDSLCRNYHLNFLMLTEKTENKTLIKERETLYLLRKYAVQYENEID